MILLLHGGDTYRSRQRLQQLRTAFRTKYDPSGWNIVQLDGETMRPEQFNEQFAAGGFLASRRFLVITNVLTKGLKTTQAAVCEMLQAHHFAGDNILVFWENDEVSKGGRGPKEKEEETLVQALLRTAKVERFAPLEPEAVHQWVLKEVQQRGGTIEEKAAARIAAAAGSDLWIAANEIEKLVHYANGHLITERDVDALVASPFDDDIFRLTDALGRRDVPSALLIMEEQLHHGADPVYLLRMITWQFRNVLSVRALVEQDIRQPAEIARELRMHPFVAQKTLRQAETFSIQELRETYGQLVSIEQSLKTSRSDPGALFTLFVTRFRRQPVPGR